MHDQHSTLFRRLRFFAALILLAASVAVNLLLLPKFLSTTIASATSSDKPPQAQGAATNLDDLRSNGNNDVDDDSNSIRIIALCGGSLYFDDAFRKMSEWLPILYAGMYPPPPEDETIPQKIWCENKIEQWVSSELRRQQIPTMSTTAIEVIYSSDNIFQRKSSLNTTLVGQSKEPPKWKGGMHTPSRRTHFQRYTHHWGEVAWSKHIKCSQDDSKIYVYRSRQLWSVAQEEDCAVVHLPAILPYLKSILKQRIQAGLIPANETMTSLLSHRLTHDQARQSLRSKSSFCILLTLTTFQPRYSTDALVRHVLCRLLTKQYKPCVAIASWKKGPKHNITVEQGIENAPEAMKDFKFVITMPNHFQDGYIAEKTLSPYLANSLAITSIPNIGQYVNAEGMISCQLPEEELIKVQMYYTGNFKWMPFNTTPEMWKSEDEIKPIKYDPYANNSTGDEPVLEFATSQWEKALQPCIEEIIRVDQDDSAYIEKLMQPYLLNEGQNSMFDGTYVAMSMLRWFLWKSSPVVGGLEDQIRSLTGMWEQTPGWGRPPVKKFEDVIDYYSKTKNEAGLYQYRPAQYQYGSVQQNTSKANISLPSKPPASGVGVATKCTFCESEGGNFNQDMMVPGTGGNTCGSIKAMAAGHLNESDVCATMQKEEWVCCPGQPLASNHHQQTSQNITKHQVKISNSSADEENEKVGLVRTVGDSSVLYNQLVSKAQQTCSNGLANDTDLSTYLGLSQEGSNDNVPLVDVLLPPDQYPILHRSCFFIPTKPENIDKHRHLLNLYPNSFLFVSVQDHPRIDSEARVIYISGVDSYELLWKKTLSVWDVVSFESSNLFKECDWFFKVDTDTFLNLHSIEQYLSIYNTSEPHYTGWYNVGGPGRKAHGKKVKIAIGAFYGVTREVILRWKDWRSDGRHVWGSFHTGEDSQMAFFLREHGTCLAMPLRNENLSNFKENYVWGGFEDIGSPMKALSTIACREKVKWLSENPCFAYAHKVPSKWMGILTGVLASHIVNNTSCSLVDKGGSRIVNGSIYHFMENITGCTTDCDPCLRDASGCCSWSLQ